MSEFVIDASAILALARGEAGNTRVAEVRAQCIVSAVNLLESFSTLVRYDMPIDYVQGFLREAFPRVEPVDRELAERSAVLHAASRSLGLSLADCVCLALGATRRATVLTADRRWSEGEFNVTLELIR